MVRGSYGDSMSSVFLVLYGLQVITCTCPLHAIVMCAHIIAASTECQRLGDQVLTLQRALADEKEVRSGAEGQLRGEAEDRCAHIARLEGALRQCQAEVASHVTRAEEDSTHNSTLIWQMRHEVGGAYVGGANMHVLTCATTDGYAVQGTEAEGH